MLYAEGEAGAPKMMSVGLHCRLVGRPGPRGGAGALPRLRAGARAGLAAAPHRHRPALARPPQAGVRCGRRGTRRAPTRPVSTLSHATAIAPDHHLKGVLLVGASAVLWSLGGLIVRSLDSADPWTTIFWRSVFATGFLLLFLLVRDGRNALRLFRDMGLPGSSSASASPPPRSASSRRCPSPRSPRRW